MVMRYHHFLGIGHTYSNAFRPNHSSPRSTPAQENIGTHEDNQNQDQEMSDLLPVSLIRTGESEEFSDTDSINTIDNGWEGWDGEGEEDDDIGGHESDVDLIDMDDMYGSWRQDGMDLFRGKCRVCTGMWFLKILVTTIVNVFEQHAPD
jgi:hypothetical protein